MNGQLNPSQSFPARHRLDALCKLDAMATQAIDQAVSRAFELPAGREVLVEGEPIAHAMLLLCGWAARMKYFHDGRRQIVNFILPGDLLGHCQQDQPIAPSTVVALTKVRVCRAPDPSVSPTLASAYAMSRALDEAYLIAQAARLGQLSAYERLVDLFLELMERLELSGEAQNGRCSLPLTQVMIADALGMSSVHVSRTLGQVRQNKLLSFGAGELVLHDRLAMASALARRDVLCQ
jgi:CRP-like cAMP-binding protein